MDRFIRSNAVKTSSQPGNSSPKQQHSATPDPSGEFVSQFADANTPPNTPGHQIINEGDWSATLQAALDEPPSAIPHRLLLGGVVFCGVLGVWVWTGKVEQVGHLQGQLVPLGQAYQLYPKYQGRIVNIAVTSGQQVKAGQVIAELDSDFLNEQIQDREQQVAINSTLLNQVKTLMQRTSAIAKTKAALVANQKDIDSAIDAAEARLAVNQEYLGKLRNKLLTNVKKRNNIKVLRNDATPQLAQPNTEIGLDRIEQVSEMVENAIVKNQGQIQQTLTSIETLKMQSKQQQAQSHLIQLSSQLQIEQLALGMTVLQAKIAESKKVLDTAKEKLKQRFILAPVDGVVYSLKIQVGELVQSGEIVAEIAPQKVPLGFSATLSKSKARFFKTGMPVEIKVDSFPYQDYGTIPGEIKSVFPDSLPGKEKSSVYRVEVALKPNFDLDCVADTSLESNTSAIKLLAGKTVTAQIIHQRRIADILLEQIKQIPFGGIGSLSTST